MITCDLGVNYICPFLHKDIDLDHIPYDTLLINVFKGNFEPTLAGPPFTGVDTMMTCFDLAYQSKPMESNIPGLTGNWYI